MIDQIKYFLELNTEDFEIDGYMFCIKNKIAFNVIDSSSLPIFIVNIVKDKEVVQFLETLKGKYNVIMAYS